MKNLSFLVSAAIGSARYGISLRVVSKAAWSSGCGHDLVLSTASSVCAFCASLLQMLSYDMFVVSVLALKTLPTFAPTEVLSKTRTKQLTNHLEPTSKLQITQTTYCKKNFIPKIAKTDCFWCPYRSHFCLANTPLRSLPLRRVEDGVRREGRALHGGLRVHLPLKRV